MNSFFTSIEALVSLGTPLTLRTNEPEAIESVNTAASGRMRIPTLMAARKRPR